jgi:hypothetical protein
MLICQKQVILNGEPGQGNDIMNHNKKQNKNNKVMKNKDKSTINKENKNGLVKKKAGKRTAKNQKEKNLVNKKSPSKETKKVVSGEKTKMQKSGKQKPGKKKKSIKQAVST